MVDMHIHTSNSDGDYTVEQIINMILELGIDMFSITDHDNIKSCSEIEKIKIPENIKYIKGVEFSSINNTYNCHILGYNIDDKNIDLNNECEIIKKRRIKKIKTIIEYLKTIYQIEISDTEKTELLEKPGTLGRIDICKLLIQKGYGTKKEIYDKYLSNIPNIKTHRSNIEQIIKIINESNGISVLAHPKEIEETYNIYIEDIIESFIEKGLDGIEIYNSIHTLKDVKRYILLAKKYNLLMTGGSDFHGSSHPERHLGYTTTKQKIIKINELKI